MSWEIITAILGIGSAILWSVSAILWYYSIKSQKDGVKEQLTEMQGQRNIMAKQMEQLTKQTDLMFKQTQQMIFVYYATEYEKVSSQLTRILNQNTSQWLRTNSHTWISWFDRYPKDRRAMMDENVSVNKLEEWYTFGIDALLIKSVSMFNMMCSIDKEKTLNQYPEEVHDFQRVNLDAARERLCIRCTLIGLKFPSHIYIDTLKDKFKPSSSPLARIIA